MKFAFFSALMMFTVVNPLLSMDNQQLNHRKQVTALVLSAAGLAASGYIINRLATAPLSARDKIFLGSIGTACYAYFLKEIIKDVRPTNEKIALAGLLALTTAACIQTTLLANHRMVVI